MINSTAIEKKRSTTEYDIAGAISDTEAKAMLALAEDVVDQVQLWLMENYPHLMKTPT